MLVVVLEKLGGLDRFYLAAINSSDSSITNWNPSSSSPIEKIVLNFDAQYVYAGSGNGLAKIKVDGTFDENWSCSASGGAIYSILTTKLENETVETIFAGGSFLGINKEETLGFCKLDSTTGNKDPSFEIKTLDDSVNISGLFKQSDGKIIVCGNFVPTDKINRRYILRLNADGSLDEGWKPMPNNYVSCVAVNSSSTSCFIAGYFTKIGEQNVKYIAKLNGTDGSVDNNWIPNPNDYVNTLWTDNDDDLYVGGCFNSIFGETINYLAKLSQKTPTVDKNWHPNPNSCVIALAGGLGNIYASGHFGQIGGHEIQYLAKLKTTDGSPDESWMPIPDYPPSKIICSPEEKYLYLLGGFSSVCNTARSGSAKISMEYPLISYDNNFKPTIDYSFIDKTWDISDNNYQVNSLAITSDGKEQFWGGTFNYSFMNGGIYSSYLCKAGRKIGIPDMNWNPCIDFYVNDIVFSGETLFIGGAFSEICGSPRKGLAAISTQSNSDGTSFGKATKIPGTFTKQSKIKASYDTYKTVNMKIIEISASFALSQFTKSLPLVDKHIWKSNKENTCAQVLESNPVLPKICDLFADKYLLPFTLNYFPPLIFGVYNQKGEKISSAKAGEIIFIKGYMFGSKPPYAWLEYIGKNGEIKKLKLKVIRPLFFSNIFGKTHKSCMDIMTGESLLYLKMPNKFPKDWAYNTYDNNISVPVSHNIVIDNNSCRATINFFTEESK